MQSPQALELQELIFQGETFFSYKDTEEGGDAYVFRELQSLTVIKQQLLSPLCCQK